MLETRLSNNEAKVFKLIPPFGRKITTGALAEKFYNGNVPTNGQTIISIYVKRIKRKSAVIKNMPRIESTEGSGRKFIEVWRAEKTKK